MKVKARRNVRDASGWHLTGEIFETKENLGDAVEVLGAQKTAEKPEKPMVKEISETPKEEPKAAEPAEAQETPKPRSSRRKVK